ncbi:predicted protein [Naegleria gruberi]|uniref:Predicted protein n=1 Tax=Naegleria gruberi TaxID=5762 RepID=D2W065_NAEGR|nr:uncharacterized protein NAEGRDRAFT_74748 [Naegleria gruberi]EFC37517.1 predicted protein [Naegleria gruberi]|eukprot:XP_002670261.1 predicted protein [Naegleria gruberi strain NEG-M]
MEVYGYFSYYRVVPGSRNEKVYCEMLLHDSTLIDSNHSENATYKKRFHKLDGVAANKSWVNIDISKYPYIEMLNYNGDELRYSESLEQTNNLGIITITYNSEIIYRASYPYEKVVRIGNSYTPNYQSPIYKNGLICEIDERKPTHSVFKFVEKMLQITLKQTRNFEISEMEQEWCSLCNSQFKNLVMIFNFRNYKHFNHLNLNNALRNSSTFSDIVFYN